MTSSSDSGYVVAIDNLTGVAATVDHQIVELDRNSPYSLEISNHNDHKVMVGVHLDDVSVGRFLLNGYSRFKLERPLDRPLNFVFCLNSEANPICYDKFKTKKNTEPPPARQPSKKEKAVKTRTKIVCIFQPELGSKTIQINDGRFHITRFGDDFSETGSVLYLNDYVKNYDSNRDHDKDSDQNLDLTQFQVAAPSLNKSQRMEMPNECTAEELINEMVADFGGWVTDASTALIHWITGEYDSPVDRVFNSQSATTLRVCKKRDESFRTMSLINIRSLKLMVNGEEEENIAITTVPTFADLITWYYYGNEDPDRKLMAAVLEKDYDQMELRNDEVLAYKPPLVGTQASVVSCSSQRSIIKDQVLYFFTDSNRFIGSTKWLPPSAYIYEMLHKDELNRGEPQLTLHATSRSPDHSIIIHAKVLDDKNVSKAIELEASEQNTISELRYQMARLGGPTGDHVWLFGATLLESGRTVKHYAIKHKNTIDIVLKKDPEVDHTNLTLQEPISIENDKPIDTKMLLQQANNTAAAKQREKERSVADRPRRAGTTLKGRSKQQFIEVDAIGIDERYVVTQTVIIVPRNEGMVSVIDGELNPEKKTAKKKKSNCCVIC